VRIEPKTRSLEFTEEDSTLTVRYSNRGDPYRDGVEFNFDNGRSNTRVLLSYEEVEKLNVKLEEFLRGNP
jgi:hypothetical protein